MFRSLGFRVVGCRGLGRGAGLRIETSVLRVLGDEKRDALTFTAVLKLHPIGVVVRSPKTLNPGCRLRLHSSTPGVEAFDHQIFL